MMIVKICERLEDEESLVNDDLLGVRLLIIFFFNSSMFSWVVGSILLMKFSILTLKCNFHINYCELSAH